MAESEVAFRDITMSSVAQQSSGVIGVSVLTALFAGLFVWARARDNSVSQQKAAQEEDMVSMKSMFGTQLVPERNLQYGVITDSSYDQLDKMWHIFKLRLKHKHRWISVFTRTENTRFQSRERVVVLYTYMLSAMTFAAILHGQKAPMFGVVGTGIMSSIYGILPAFLVAQLFKNSRSEEQSNANSNGENENNGWNTPTGGQRTSKCGMFFATLCAGQLDSEDTLAHSRQNAFSPAVNMFAYFVALIWMIECIVIIIAFTVQFDLIPVEMPEGTAWGVSIVVAALWDFFFMQPLVLAVVSMATVFTTRMFKGRAGRNAEAREEEEQADEKPAEKKQPAEEKAARKELTINVGSTRGNKKKASQVEEEIKTQPITLGRTQGGSTRELRKSSEIKTPRSALYRSLRRDGGGGSRSRFSSNFLIDGDSDTTRLATPSHSHAQRLSTPSNSASFVTVSSTGPEVRPLPASPSSASEASTYPASPSAASISPQVQASQGLPPLSASPQVQASQGLPPLAASPPAASTSPQVQASQDQGLPPPPPPEPNVSPQPATLPASTPGASAPPPAPALEQPPASPSQASASSQAPPPPPPESKTPEASDSENEEDELNLPEVVPNVTHPHQTIRGRKLKSPSFVAAMNYHKKKRNSIQPPGAAFLSTAFAPTDKDTDVGGNNNDDSDSV